MRLGVLADVHANLPALRRALAVLREAGAERLVCLGDLVGYGAQPNECVEELLAAGAVCVAGNHDLMAIGALPVPPELRAGNAWTARSLSPATAAALARLPPRAELPDGVVAAHGSLADPCEYVEDVGRAAAELARLAPGERVLLLGHVHRPFAVGSGRGRRPTLPGRDLALASDERHLLNPGAVGQARELRRRARCLLLDTGARSARFFEPRYDAGEAVAALRRGGLPADALHRRPRLARVARGELRRMAWRIGA